jgi:hypothetical protein
MINPFPSPMPYHDRRAAREAPHGLDGWWRCSAWAALAWLLVVALGQLARRWCP